MIEMIQCCMYIVNTVNRVIKVRPDQLESQGQLAEKAHPEKLALEVVLENLVLQ